MKYEAMPAEKSADCPDPLTIVLKSEERDAVGCALTRLDDLTRTVIAARHGIDRDRVAWAKLSEETGRSKSYLNRVYRIGIARLSRFLQELDPNSSPSIAATDNAVSFRSRPSLARHFPTAS